MGSGAIGMGAFQTLGLAEKVAFLSDPRSYPHRPPSVEAKETHMSWVFLAGELVYKLKKPVTYPFLDFATLQARRANCLEEARLNARLAEDIYIGVAPLHATEAGELSLRPPGDVVEWLVCMKRLPASRMLDELIATAAVASCDVERAAAKLASFYAAAQPIEVSADWVHARFAAEHELDAQILSDSRFDLETSGTRQTLALMRSALVSVGPHLQKRAAATVYVEGHGDLRPEHVCLLPQPVFIDCLEFNRDLRILDPFDEIAYLGLECERLGAAWIGEIFLSAARHNLSSPAPPLLINFYRAARALLRARLALAHLTEPAPRTPGKWEPRARHYIRIAHASLQAMNSGSAAEP